MICYKKVLILLILGLLVSACGDSGDDNANTNPNNTNTQDITSGLLAYFPFNGDTLDESGNQNDGTNNGAALTADRNGNIDSAYSFNGVDTFIEVPLNINPDVHAQLTMTAWVRPTDDAAIKQIISHDNGGYDRSMGIDSRGGALGWSAFSGNGGVLGAHTITLNQWVFVAVVYDQDQQTVKLYVNNNMIEEAGTTGTGWDYLYIGDNPSFTEHFAGDIDEVRIYSRALNDAEINALYTN